MSIIQKSVFVYQRLGGGPSTFSPVDIIDYVPVINKKDRDNGEIVRYFTRPVHQSSPSEIVEIDKSTFQRLSNNKLYNVVSLRWLIRGKVTDVPGLTNINTPTRLYTGVHTANRLFVEAADEKMPGLKTIIIDYLKFWQGE
jgi:hypothetical protein